VGRQALLQRAAAATDAEVRAADPAAAPPDWAALLRPKGAETRLGDALLQAIREQNSETLSGIVVISDGQSNAGIDPGAVSDMAVAAKVRVVPVGVGSTRRPVSLQLAEIQAPTHVHVKDGFTITAFLSGQGLARQPVTVELLTKAEGDEGEPAVVLSHDEQLFEDGVPISVSFDYTPSEPGKRLFRVRARPANRLPELDFEFVQDDVTIEVIDRKTRVLLLAGGPMRDYQFVRNLLHRDKSVAVDILLQTGSPGLAQESDDVIFEFPSTREELFNYDVIVAFDPDWARLRGETGESLALLAEWSSKQAGGLVLVAGDVFTPRLASAAEALREQFEDILKLYPVLLEAQRTIDDDDRAQPWPVAFTREGLEAGFLQLTDNPVTSAAAWKEFAGVYRCFPTTGVKAGATVYARFSDPRSPDAPVLLASQFYGAGRIIYLGSPEMYRLRALDDAFYDRFWIKLLREVGQGRLLRGTNRGILLMEKTQYPLGSTVPVRARLLDPQFKDYQAEQVGLEVFDPHGKPLAPPVALLGDASRPGQFAGAFIATIPGTYRLELPIPDTDERLTGMVSVRLPNLEFEHPEQNEALLRRLARLETGGAYLTLDQAARELPQLLPDRTVERVQYDQPHALWDRQWVMYVLVGLLGVEWLTRKLLKLA